MSADYMTMLAREYRAKADACWTIGKIITARPDYIRDDRTNPISIDVARLRQREIELTILCNSLNDWIIKSIEERRTTRVLAFKHEWERS